MVTTSSSGLSRCRCHPKQTANSLKPPISRLRIFLNEENGGRRRHYASDFDYVKRLNALAFSESASTVILRGKLERRKPERMMQEAKMEFCTKRTSGFWEVLQ